MPAFSAQQLQNSARNANTVTVLIGTTPIAFAQTVSHSFDLGTEQLHGVGSAMVQEVQQLRISPQITIDAFALTAAGQALLTNGTSIAALLVNNSFNFFIVDGITGNALFTYVGGVASNFNENIASNQPITDAITFMCLDVWGPTGLSLLNPTGVNSVNGTPNAFQVPVNNAGVAANGLGQAGISSVGND